MNIIEGPGPSSVDIRVMGTGLLVNLGSEAWRNILGRSEAVDGGRLFEGSDLRVVLSGSLSDAGALPASDAVFEYEAMFEMEGGFAREVSFGSKVKFGAEVVVVGSVNHGLPVGLSGTLTSLSPVDLFDGGGPLMVSERLFRRRTKRF